MNEEEADTSGKEHSTKAILRIKEEEATQFGDGDQNYQRKSLETLHVFGSHILT